MFEVFRLLGCDAVWSGRNMLMFRMHLLLPSFAMKMGTVRKPVRVLNNYVSVTNFKIFFMNGGPTFTSGSVG